MALEDEIAVKLGIKTAEFKAALIDADAGVKSFSKSAGKSTEEFGEKVKALKMGTRELREVLEFAGMAKIVEEVFKAAEEAANRAGNEFDEDAIAVRRFSEAMKDTKGIVGEFAMHAVGAFNRIGETLGGIARFAIDSFKLGNEEARKAESLAESSQKAAEEAENRLAKLRKEHGEELKQLTKEIEAEQKKVDDAQRARLPLDEQLLVLHEEITRQTQIYSDASSDAVTKRKALLAVLRAEGEAQKLYQEQEKIRREDILAASKAQDEIALKGMETARKIAFLTLEIRDGEQAIAYAKRLGSSYSTLEAEKKERVKKLNEVLGDQEKERVETKKKVAGGTEEELEWLALVRKATTGILEGPEKSRYEQLKLMRKERETDIELTKLAEEAMVRQLTPAEEKRLIALEKQKKALEAGLKAIKDMADLPPTVSPPVEATAKAFEGYVKQFEKFTAEVRNSGPGDYKSMSDQQLAYILGNLQTQYNDTKFNAIHNPRGPGYSSINGISDLDASVMAAIEAQMAPYIEEQRKRSQATSLSRVFGEKSGLSFVSNDPSEQQRLSQYLQSNNQQLLNVNDGVNNVGQILARVFPNAAASASAGRG